MFTDAASSGKAGGKHGKSVAGLKVKGMSGKCVRYTSYLWNTIKAFAVQVRHGQPSPS